jgi:25S rRNA (adenine2142-N1)-methyltransferase
MPKKKKRTILSQGRPPRFDVPKVPLSSKATRTLIRSHHVLQKALTKAVNAGDQAKADELRDQIEDQGGLKAYQEASKLGQSTARGGDSSKVLMQWLVEEGFKGPVQRKYSMLEVGALSSTNACSLSGLFDVTRIDLNSQEPMIEQQDFMERPLSTSNDGCFDAISLSLVLNYVPDAIGRGAMLKRTRNFLKEAGEEPSIFPTLFLVLPSPCITNSRYMTEEHLDAIMESIGYAKLKQKISAKLVYSLWRYGGEAQAEARAFPKTETNPGKGRNNFSIIIL